MLIKINGYLVDESAFKGSQPTYINTDKIVAVTLKSVDMIEVRGLTNAAVQHYNIEIILDGGLVYRCEFDKDRVAAEALIETLTAILSIKQNINTSEGQK